MLKDEITRAQRRVRTDAFQMSLGEIVNLYREGELIINPDFQRYFRWEIGQKSKFIESILLGIPIPSIFVFETETGTWELIDGLQRVSTILEFMGFLNDPDGSATLPPSALVATKYLPSLFNTVWEKSKAIPDVPFQDQLALDKTEQITIRRARIGVEILKRPSDNDTKYDLFQRLNGGGTAANPQEMRNCIVIMVDKDFFNLVARLADDPHFRTVTQLTDDAVERQRHMEYAMRFLVHLFIDYDGKLDVEEYIDDGIVKVAKDVSRKRVERIFLQTFSLLNDSLGANALRRYDGHRHVGRVGLVALEAIAIGVAENISSLSSKSNPERLLKQRVEDFWQEPKIQQFMAPGLRGTYRIQRTVKFGKKYFKFP